MKKGLWYCKTAAALVGAVLLWTGCSARELQPSGQDGGQELLQTEEPARVQDTVQNVSQTGQTKEAQREEEAFLWKGAEEVSHFAYDSLTEEEQLWYRDIERTLGSMGEEIRLSEAGIAAGLSETSIDSIFQCVLNDHPELFFVEGYTYTKYTRGDRLLALDFSGTYGLDREEALLRKSRIEEEAELLLSGIPEGAAEYDRVKYVYETLIKNTEYDLEAFDNQNIYSVFVNHTSVCQGYAKAAQYLLNRLGLSCTLVMGTVDTGEAHAWNLVQVDGSWYYLDVTWGDASYKAEGPEEEEGLPIPEINYDYLCVTTWELLRTHTLTGPVPMPECTAREANYYVREGAYFSSLDREQLKRLFESAAKEGKTDVTVKCSDYECFRELCSALIEKQEIFDYALTDSRTIAYAHNEKQLSLTFWVTNE